MKSDTERQSYRLFSILFRMALVNSWVVELPPMSGVRTWLEGLEKVC